MGDVGEDEPSERAEGPEPGDEGERFPAADAHPAESDAVNESEGDEPTAEADAAEPAVDTVPEPAADEASGDQQSAVTESFEPLDGKPVPAAASTGGDEPAATGRKRGRARSVLVGMLVLLTSISVILAVTSAWAHRTVFDTNAWLKIVGPLPQEPGVAEAASQFVVTKVTEVVDLQGTVEQALPSQLDPLIGVVADRVRTIVQDQLTTFIGSDTFQNAWIEVNRVAHDAAIKLLRGDTTRLVTGPNGEVRLNLVPLLYRGLEFLQEHVSFVLQGHTVPTGVDPLTDPAGAVQALSAEFGRSLPADFAQPVVFQSDSLAAAQDAVKVFDKLFVVALILPLVLAAIAIVLSRRRRRTVVQIAIGAAVAVVLAAAVVRKLQEAIVDKVKNPSGREAVRDTVAAVVHGLRMLLIAVLIVGAVVAIVAYLAGRPAWLVRAAAAVKRATGGERAQRIEAYVAARETVFIWTGVALAIGVLFLTGLSWTPFLVIASFLGLWVLGVVGLARRSTTGDVPLGAEPVT